MTKAARASITIALTLAMGAAGCVTNDTLRMRSADGYSGAGRVQWQAVEPTRPSKIGLRFSGLVVGLPAGDLDVDPFPIIDPEDANRIAILHCANLGNKNARVRVAYFDESGEPFVFDKRLESNTGFTLTTSNEGVSGIALDFIDIEQIKAGLGLVLANRTEIACSAQVLNRFSQYVYDLPLERVARNGE